MKNWTGIEIEHSRQELEQASAIVLGRMLFEFSRLDVALGLFLVWSDGGSQVEKLTTELQEKTFHKKLEFLQELVNAKHKENKEIFLEYSQWLEDAHATRLLRNDLVHGRWGIDAVNERVINVIGLPTSPNQREFRYTIPELKRALEQMEQLQIRLQKFRERHTV